MDENSSQDSSKLKTNLNPKGNDAILQMRHSAWLTQEKGVKCPLAKQKRNRF